MANEEIKSNLAEDQNIEVVKDPQEDPSPQQEKVVPFKEGIAPYLGFLESMRVNKKHLDTAPTFTPKNFYEQIQFYDTGGVRRLYLYINGDWRYVVLT